MFFLAERAHGCHREHDDFVRQRSGDAGQGDGGRPEVLPRKISAPCSAGKLRARTPAVDFSRLRGAQEADPAGFADQRLQWTRRGALRIKLRTLNKTTNWF